MGIKIGRMSGPGPVFIYERITSARRWQGYAVRALFILSLLAALLVMGMSRRAVTLPPGASAIRAQAQLGESLFVAVVGTQLTLVLLAAPLGTFNRCLGRVE